MQIWDSKFEKSKNRTSNEFKQIRPSLLRTKSKKQLVSIFGAPFFCNTLKQHFTRPSLSLSHLLSLSLYPSLYLWLSDSLTLFLFHAIPHFLPLSHPQFAKNDSLCIISRLRQLSLRISSTFCSKLLLAQIPKVQRRLRPWMDFLCFLGLLA